jgi:hypothetical protein
MSWLGPCFDSHPSTTNGINQHFTKNLDFLSFEGIHQSLPRHLEVWVWRRSVVDAGVNICLYIHTYTGHSSLLPEVPSLQSVLQVIGCAFKEGLH